MAEALPAIAETTRREYVAALEAGALDKAALFDPWLAEDSDHSLIDIGTGPGGVAARLAELRRGWQVLGIDRDPEMLRCARSRHGGPGNLRFVRGDALDGPGRAAAAVVLSSVLHEICSEGGMAAVARALEAAADALVAGGRLIVRDFVLPENPRRAVVLEHRRSDIRPGRSFSAFVSRAPGAVTLRSSRITSTGVSYETDLAGAYEFMFRKDHRATWDDELRQRYGFWTERRARELVRAAGLRLLHVARVEALWMRRHRLDGRVVLRDPPTGRELDLPAHKLLLVAEKPG